MSGGEFRESWDLLSLGGPIPIDFTQIYAPDLVRKSPSNDGRTQFPPWPLMSSFTSNTVARCIVFLDTGVEPPVRYANVFVSDDSFILREDAGVFRPLGPDKYALNLTENWLYFMNPTTGRVSIFRTRPAGWQAGDDFIERIGELAAVIDRNGNSILYTYNPDNNPTRIEDGLGRSIDLTYIESADIAERHLIQVTDGYGRSVDFQYEPCAASSQPYLASFTDTLGRTTSFEYDLAANNRCELLSRIANPRGNSRIDQTWVMNPKGIYAVDVQRDADGNQTSLAYGLNTQENIVTTVTHPDGGEASFTHLLERYPQEIRDEEGRAVTMDYNPDMEITSITDRTLEENAMRRKFRSGMVVGFLALFVLAFTNPASAEKDQFYGLTPLARGQVRGALAAMKDQGAYSAVFLPDFTVKEVKGSKDEDIGDPELTRAFVPELVVEHLNAFFPGAFGTIQRTDGGPDQPGIVVNGTVDKFVIGSFAKRAWIGFGAGKDKLEGHFSLVDSATGKEIYAFEVLDSNWGAGWQTKQGQIRDMSDQLARDIAYMLVQIAVPDYKPPEGIEVLFDDTPYPMKQRKE